MVERIRILGFAGSLRKGSYNRALLREATTLVPQPSVIETFDLNAIPPFNQDNENQPSEVVKEFKSRVRAADAILIVTPEYNYSMPGVLKNAIDSASRPSGDNSWDGKPVAIMSASTGMLGGARAQYHLRQSMVFLNMHPVNRPEVIVTFAPQKFDAEGHLLDEKAKELVIRLLQELIDWTVRLRAR
jgi:chromate reductase, NAD(P)H dehydrogenase (quinone)